MRCLSSSTKSCATAAECASRCARTPYSIWKTNKQSLPIAAPAWSAAPAHGTANREPFECGPGSAARPPCCPVCCPEASLHVAALGISRNVHLMERLETRQPIRTHLCDHPTNPEGARCHIRPDSGDCGPAGACPPGGIRTVRVARRLDGAVAPGGQRTGAAQSRQGDSRRRRGTAHQARDRGHRVRCGRKDSAQAISMASPAKEAHVRRIDRPAKIA